MPGWTVHPEFDPWLGALTLRIGCSLGGDFAGPLNCVSTSAQTSNPKPSEVFVRPLVHAVINTIERRYAESVHLPASEVWPNAVEQVRRISWDAPCDQHLALFFHSSVNPVELYADAVCHQAGAGQFAEWKEGTWKALQTSFESLMLRPLRFFIGVDQVAVRRAKHDGYEIVQVRP